MKKTIISTLSFLMIIISTSFAQSIMEENVYFNSDEHTLDEVSLATLQNLANRADEFNEFSLQIIGQTDQDGTQSYNMDLSKRRAEEVKDYFVNNGIPMVNIEVSFVGESNLVNQSSDEIAKQLNRKVSIVAMGFSYDNVTDFVTQLQTHEDDNTRIINQNIESNLKLSKGTEVKIPTDAFCHLDGSPLANGQVDLAFKEVFDFVDMVDNRLFTQTEDQLIETGGMIHIAASQDGKLLRLQDGKSIELTLPMQEQKNGMELFTGSEDENGVIWQETGVPIESELDEKDELFVQVDLSPLLKFEFDDMAMHTLEFAPMPAYPAPARIAYPPYEENYSEDEFVEAVKKYEEVMKAHEEDKITRPARLEEWLVEANKRRDILFEHKKNYIILNTFNQLKASLARLEKDQDRISHERLVNVLFAFLGREVGKVRYEEWPYVKKTFGGTVVNVREEIGLDFPLYDKRIAGTFFPEFLEAIKEVKGDILVKKYEMGYVDEAVFSRYVIMTSNIGWINCDRFLELSENEKMDLEFATASPDNQFYLIFKNIRSMIRPEMNGNLVTFKGIPRGEDVRLLAVNLEGKDAHLAKLDFTLGSQERLDLAYAPVKIKEFKQILEDI